ncbi:rCG44094 [Rattus norvegicus]|uniref:RCG44094 n=1 Tax=Rattus norvegicus TaxID=10116 RepID=A6J7C3_RAT|nr:rCG44094 [Rattus norvegicus]
MCVPTSGDPVIQGPEEAFYLWAKMGVKRRRRPSKSSVVKVSLIGMNVTAFKAFR